MAIPQDKLKSIMDGVEDKIRHAYNCGEDAGRKEMIEKYKAEVGEKVDRALNQNKGMWKAHTLTEVNIHTIDNAKRIECDQCNTVFTQIGYESWHYCPHCGAVMSYYLSIESE